MSILPSIMPETTFSCQTNFTRVCSAHDLEFKSGVRYRSRLASLLCECPKRIGNVLKAMACQNTFVAGVFDRLQIRGLTDDLDTRLPGGIIKEGVSLSHLSGPNCASTIQAVVQRPKNIVNGELPIAGKHRAWPPYFETTSQSQMRAILGREHPTKGLLSEGRQPRTQDFPGGGPSCSHNLHGNPATAVLVPA